MYLIGFEDDFVQNEDLGKRKSKRSRKVGKARGYLRCLRKFNGKVCNHEGDCGPYGSCQTRGNGNDKFMVSIGDPWGESGG